MSTVKPFKAVRPKDNEFAKLIASLPYDVYTREEARKAVEGKPWSFLNIDRPETYFEPEHDMYAHEVYAKAKEEYERWKAEGALITELRPSYYVYELTMDGRTQTGIVGVTAVSDYENGFCRKHENTVAEKEADRISHVDTLSAQTGPIFLAYHGNPAINQIVNDTKVTKPMFDFTSEEGIRQRVWRMDYPPLVKMLEGYFEFVEFTYIADGHHRAASAVKVSQKRRKNNSAPGICELTSGDDRNDIMAGRTVKALSGWSDSKNTFDDDKIESEYFLSVLFPDSELKILDYNRIVKDLNGLSASEFIAKIENETPFSVEKIGKCGDPEIMRPSSKNRVGMYLCGEYYMLTVDPSYASSVKDDPVKSLDVSILQDTLLDPILGIGDPRTDKRIKFVGGIRGLLPLKDEVDSLTADGNCAVSFAMNPTSMDELFKVADAGLLMPPKSTWFEPKLRSGLFIHEI
ncbi:MAG: DUF1015 family protein [Lachnospiraceae bacterium]|nr:DUF1015 family protein [Lachnospiraceae bacterium]